MCDPVSAMVISGIGVGANAYGQYQQVQAQNQAAEYNAQLLEQNAQIEDIKAAQTVRRGQKAESSQRRHVAQLIGKQRASFGGSGAVVDTGSALDIITDTAYFGEQDALTIKHNAALEAWGSKVKGQQFRSRASLLRKGKQDPFAASGTTLLTGLGSLATNYGARFGTSSARI